MKFLCLITAEKVMEQMPPDFADRHYEDYREFTQSLRNSGHLVGVNRLLPATVAKTVRVRDGKVLATDGPFAETKEQIGGYYVIEARDMAEAVGIAARIPAVTFGSVEVRPIADDERTLDTLGLK